jgi:nicotinate-nucleotide pyrophosphorylase (carboxylating)
MNHEVIKEIVSRALQEDLGTGDITTDSIVPAGELARGLLYSKSSGVLAGVEVARLVFQHLSPQVTFVALKNDGQPIRSGDLIAEVFGSAGVILSGERVALNFLQRLSGIASQTQRYVERVKDYKAKIVDTRKTTPGLRVLEKYAVRMGGGSNHRFGLYDAVLIKDNHIKVAGSIQAAVKRVRRQIPHTIKIEVEVEDLAQLQEALEAKVEIVLLDNMAPALLRQAVEVTGGRALLEASGGITEENVAEVAATGVDLISVGALTHSVKALDISLDIGEIKGAQRSLAGNRETG